MANPERDPFVLDFPNGQRVEDILKKADADYSKAEIDVKMASKAATSDVQRETQNLQNQINELVRGVGTEVYQARVGVDGTTYQTLGERIGTELTAESTRASAEEESIRYSISDIIKAANLETITPALEPGGLVGTTGAETSNNKRVRTGFIPVAAENWTITVPEGFAGHGVYYDETKARVGETGLWALVGTSTREAPAGAAYIRIMIKDDAGTAITPTDVIGTAVFFKTKLQEIATELLEVESEIGQTNSDVDNIVDSLSLSDFSPVLESGGLVASTGAETTNSKRVRTEFIRQLSKSCTVTIPTNYEAIAVYYNSSRARVGADATWRTGKRSYATTDDTTYLRLMFRSAPEADITPDDVTGVKITFPTELSKTLREKSTSDWNLNTLIAAGLYNHMNSSPVASNAPVGEDSSKPFKLINYYDGITASTVRQMFWSYTTGYIYVRYQISRGNFSTWKRIGFSADSTYTYNADNKLLTMETDKCRYIFKHMVDASIRLSAWRLYQGDLKVGTSYINMWQNSDAEGVIHLEGEDDHLSGYHGDELNGTAQIYVNGVPLDMAEDSSGTFTTLTIKCTSDVYHCNTSEQADTKAFTREKELEFTTSGYKVHQHWIAADAVTIDRGAQGLFQCYKTSGTNTVLYGLDADYIVGMQSPDFDDRTVYLDNRTVNVSMYTIGGKITITALQGYDNEYYRPNIRDFESQNRDKIYLDMFNGKHLAVGESIYTSFKVDFR